MNRQALTKNPRLARVLSFIALSLLVFGCAEGATAPVVTSCELPSDQSGTLSGYWALKPVPIAFHAGDWAASEMSAMTAAADTWNTFYNTSQKFQIIDYGGSSTSPRTSSISLPSSPCSESIVGTQYSAPVVIYKDATWTYGSTLIALTRFCTNTSVTTSLKPMTMAYIEVNYQNYFVSGQEVPDLQSIILHEMGHLAGLNHSCELDVAGFPVCSTNATYTDAVMAPVFTFDTSGNGEQKRALTSNDEGRANCLYDGAITGTSTTTTTN
jgi:hypothetical protein